MATPTPARSRALAWTLFTLGVAGTGALVVIFGADDVLDAVARVGWGMAIVSAWRALPLLFSTLAWRALLPRAGRPHLGALFTDRWIAESVNNLLPAAQVGGDIVRARLATVRGVPAAVAGASVVVDITAGLLTQVIFAISGLALLLAGGRSSASKLIGLGVGLLLLIAMLGGFAWFQRSGLFRKLIRRMGRSLGDREGDGEDAGEALESAIADLYRARGSLATCSFFRLVAWALGAVEVWIVLRSMGIDAGLGDAVILESLGQAARTAGFLIPGALGVQEGGYVFLGSLTGLSAGTSLALSLAKRAREIITGLPGLVAWQVMEARLRKAPSSRRTGEPEPRSPRATRA